MSSDAWISVEDRLPDPDTDVLCTLPADRWNPARVRALHWSSGKGLKKPKPRWEEIKGCLSWTLPTHWMPYPAPFTKETP